jgi:sugar fermentation stimulation protein A
MTNKLVREALENGTIQDFGIIHSIKQEIKVSDNSRLDFYLQTDTGQVYMEVKNCSLAENGIAMFPDAVTSRGTKHLEELLRLRQNGHQAAIFFCVQRTDCTTFKAAVAIDPRYADTLKKAIHYGVKAFVYQAHVSPQAITITSKIPFLTIR